MTVVSFPHKTEKDKLKHGLTVELLVMSEM